MSIKTMSNGILTFPKFFIYNLLQLVFHNYPNSKPTLKNL
ncbi:hypothetical protein EV05_1937 [Prochlorococcus sp. MIT 0601]|nr:hypothetical protein EV05_1937 [Prochlorococcus sp. MIT 0601]